MIKKLALLGLFAALSLSMQCQHLQLGLSTSFGLSIFHKGESTYNDDFFEAKAGTGIGLAVPVYIKINDSWALKTGIGFQNKKYEFAQDKFDFTNLVEGTGSFYYKIKFTATEIHL